MEYLMSYGWAILVVMVVGASLWQLGILKMGGSVAPTSSGFQLMRPLLQHCLFKASIPQFSCRFSNNAGSDIYIRDVSVRVNGKYCGLPQAYRSDSANAESRYGELWKIVDSSGNPVLFFFWDRVGGFYAPAAGLGVGDGVLAKKEELFWITTESWFPPNTANTGADDPCLYLKPGTPLNQRRDAGNRFVMDVDITYYQKIGEVIALKHSLGSIQLPLEPG
jgi:hypothetical protein